MEFRIFTSKRTFVIFTKSEAQKTEWLHRLWECIAAQAHIELPSAESTSYKSSSPITAIDDSQTEEVQTKSVSLDTEVVHSDYFEVALNREPSFSEVPPMQSTPEHVPETQNENESREIVIQTPPETLTVPVREPEAVQPLPNVEIAPKFVDFSSAPEEESEADASEEDQANQGQSSPPKEEPSPPPPVDKSLLPGTKNKYFLKWLGASSEDLASWPVSIGMDCQKSFKLFLQQPEEIKMEHLKASLFANIQQNYKQKEASLASASATEKADLLRQRRGGQEGSRDIQLAAKVLALQEEIARKNETIQRNQEVL